jgi:hypothetical protein
MKNLSCVLGTMLLVSACTTPPAPPAPAPGPQPMAYGTLAQVMQAIPFHNSNIIFDTQSNDPEPKEKEGAKGAQGQSDSSKATEAYSSVYGGWTAVENAAIALSETANLIMIPRMCRNGKPAPIEQEDYKKFVQGLVDAGQVSLKAAQAKNLDEMVNAAGVVTEACAACHEVYRDKENEADRCTPPAAQ